MPCPTRESVLSAGRLLQWSFGVPTLPFDEPRGQIGPRSVSETAGGPLVQPLGEETPAQAQDHG
eukprot:7802507-Alexandrium_andersonii.AAC.1